MAAWGGMGGNLARRVLRLETRENRDAPSACIIYHPRGAGWWAEVEVYATRERMPLAEYERRWPRHPVLKAYLAGADEDGCGWLDLV